MAHWVQTVALVQAAQLAEQGVQALPARKFPAWQAEQTPALHVAQPTPQVVGTVEHAGGMVPVVGLDGRGAGVWE